MVDLTPLRRFVASMTETVAAQGDDEAAMIARGGELLRELIAGDGWLEDAYAQPHPDHYQQYLLHCDPLERFSVVSFVWGPGQTTPVHDHMVWGLIGVLRGSELEQHFDRDPETGLMRAGSVATAGPGSVSAVSPRIGDVHKVSNGLADRVSVSIHVYGGNIGAVRRHVFDAATGAPRTFISGYSNRAVPNLWGYATPGIQG